MQHLCTPCSQHVKTHSSPVVIFKPTRTFLTAFLGLSQPRLEGGSLLVMCGLFSESREVEHKSEFKAMHYYLNTWENNVKQKCDIFT